MASSGPNAVQGPPIGQEDAEFGNEGAATGRSERGEPRLNFADYDQSAFGAGDSVLGAWRQTDAEFHIRSPSVRSSKGRWNSQGSVGEGDDAWSFWMSRSLRSQPRRHSEAEMTSHTPIECTSCEQHWRWWHVRGIRGRHPAFHAFLSKRIGTGTSVGLVTSFALFEASRFIMAEYSVSKSVNQQSINVVASGCSLLIALLLSFLLEGTKAFIKVFSWHPLWRFLGVAMLFASAGALEIMAMSSGATVAQVVTVGYVYMPISAVLSYFIFRRLYGRLEWLAMGMLTLAILAFVFLREQSKGNTTVDIQRIRSQYSIPGLFIILCSVFTSVMASILAERIFKDRSKGLKWWCARFYVMKVHMDFGEFVISAAIWALPFVVAAPRTPLLDKAWPTNQTWFGDWGWQQYLMVAVLIVHHWLAGLLVKEFSTVMRALTQSLTLILVMCVEDPVLGNRYHFVARELPTVVLTVIIFLCAMIFQTGRINLRDIREASNLKVALCDNNSKPGEQGALQVPAGSTLSRSIRNMSSMSDSSSEDSTGAGVPCARKVEAAVVAVPIRVEDLTVSAAVAGPGGHFHLAALLTTYALILVYTISDAVRNLVLQSAMASTSINANSMGLMQYICGVAFASCLTLYTHGWPGIREAWQLKKILKCTPAGFLFAVQATLMNMAYSQGISAALALILGRVYIPVAALGARCVLGKFYMWLEYAAICILTLATVVFGYLKGFDIVTGTPKVTHAAAMLLVMASATTAAFNSLITERILKGETVAFHLQKIRLDVASTISSLVLLPIVGVITVRVQDIPWVNRPVSRSCTNSVCWDMSNGGCADPHCDCECAQGVFAGWTASTMRVIMLALIVGIGYNWLVGKLVQRFSTVHRCIADSFSLLLIYFVGDPVLNHTRLDNMCLNLVAFIVPLSSGLFAVAASEMQWVMEAVSALRGGCTDDRLATSRAAEQDITGSRKSSPSGETSCIATDMDALQDVVVDAGAAAERQFVEGRARMEPVRPLGDCKPSSLLRPYRSETPSIMRAAAFQAELERSAARDG